jgi:hypothetical protein
VLLRRPETERGGRRHDRSLTFRANKSSAADFVAQIANQVPEFYQQMVSLEIIRARESFGQASEKS